MWWREFLYKDKDHTSYSESRSRGLRKTRLIEDYFIGDYSEYLRRNYNFIQ